MRWLDGITNSMDVSLSELRDGQGGLVCYNSWGRKESDTTERMNSTIFKAALFIIAMTWKQTKCSFTDK